MSSANGFISNAPFTRERFQTLRVTFFQTVGVLILFYCFIPIPIFFLLSLMSLVRSLCQFLTLLLLSPWRMLAGWSLPAVNLNLFLPLCVLSTLSSFYLVNSVSRSTSKRYPWPMRRTLVTFVWLGLVLIQVSFLLIPLTRRHEQVSDEGKSFPSSPGEEGEEASLANENKVRRGQTCSTNVCLVLVVTGDRWRGEMAKP